MKIALPGGDDENFLFSELSSAKDFKQNCCEGTLVM
jgi:hypothetical protein